MLIELLIENTYIGGHECERTVTLDAEPADVRDQESALWEQDIFDETGCTCGNGPTDTVGSCYTVTVTGAPDPELVGLKSEWID